MDLVLWRHAEAIDLELVGDDMLRTLTPRGEKQAQRVGAWLDRQLPASTKILVSPAARAEQTAKALDRKYKVHAALAPLASVDDLLALVHWPHASGCFLVVGHQPTLGQTVSRLLGMADAEFSIKKGCMWWLRLREREAGVEVAVVAVLTPDLV
jgi:phosphohistidine phosphatase